MWGWRELRDGAGFALEALAQFRVSRRVFGENFDGDFTVQASVVGAIDFAHTAGTKSGDDLVRAQARSGCQCHCGWLQCPAIIVGQGWMS